MAVRIKNFEWFKAGAILGAFIAIVLPIVNQLVGQATYGVTFSVYNIRANLQAFIQSGKGFSEMLLHLAGIQWSLPSILGIALGTGLLVILSRYIIGAILPRLKAQDRMVAVFALASVLLGFITAGGFNQAIGMFSVELLVFAALTGFVLSYLVRAIYKRARLTIPA